MLCVESTRRVERPKASCPKRAYQHSSARLVRLGSLAPFASQFRFLIPFAPAASAQELEHALRIASAHFIRQTASRFSNTTRRYASLTSDGLRPRTLRPHLK